VTTDTFEVVQTSNGTIRVKEAGSDGNEVSFDASSGIGPDSPRPVQIAVLQDIVGLKLREIAFAAAVSRQTVLNWKKADSHERPSRYDDLRAVTERLLDADVLEPGLIGAWFRSRNRGLGYARPLEGIRAGAFDQVIEVAESLIGGSPPAPAFSPRDRRQKKAAFLQEADPDQELAEIGASAQERTKAKNG